jgi:hypothetical protein
MEVVVLVAVKLVVEVPKSEEASRGARYEGMKSALERH